MPRTLPWLKPGSSASASSPLGPSKRQRLSDALMPAGPGKSSSLHRVKSSPSLASPLFHVQNPNKLMNSIDGRRKSDQALRGQRTPSTSPPPEAPEVEFMREGLNADDIYIMVEDEFLSAAQTFTAHLHQAEYIRQRQLAKERNMRDTSAISRPTDGKAQLGADKVMEKLRLQQGNRIGKSMKAAGEKGRRGDSDAEQLDNVRQDTRAGTSLLDLMVSPRKAHRSLMGLHEPALNTRAAAGFKHAQTTPVKSRKFKDAESRHSARSDLPREEESTTASEDDLDATPTRRNPFPRSGQTRHQVPYKRKDSSSPPSKVGITDQRERSSGTDLSPRTPSRPGHQLKDRTIKDEPASFGLSFDGFLRPTPLPNAKRRRPDGQDGMRIKQEDKDEAATRDTRPRRKIPLLSSESL